MPAQIIKKGNKPEWAAIPFEAYLQLIVQAEMLQNIQDYEGAKEA